MINEARQGFYILYIIVNTQISPPACKQNSNGFLYLGYGISIRYMPYITYIIYYTFAAYTTRYFYEICFINECLRCIHPKSGVYHNFFLYIFFSVNSCCYVIFNVVGVRTKRFLYLWNRFRFLYRFRYRSSFV